MALHLYDQCDNREGRNPSDWYPHSIDRRSSLVSPTSTLTTSFRTATSEREREPSSSRIPATANANATKTNQHRFGSVSPTPSSCCSTSLSSHSSSIATRSETLSHSYGSEEFAMFNLTNRRSSPKGKAYRHYFARHRDERSESSTDPRPHAVPRPDGTGFDLEIPPPKHLTNAGGSDYNDDVHPRKRRMKKQRKTKTAAGTIGGMVVGGVALGPIGVLVGALWGGVTAREVARKGEKRAQRRHEQKSFRRSAFRKGTHWEESEVAVYV